MWDFVSSLLDVSGFPARWLCGNWTPVHGWLHIVSDVAIFGAYAAIPLSIGLYVRKRKEVVFPKLWWLFACFIFSCGIGHLIEATIFWHPWYRLSGLVKLVTALFSWATVVAIIKYLPEAAKWPQIVGLNQQLSREIQERRSAEAEALRLNAELRDKVEELKALLDVIPVGIGIANDRDCRSIRSNDSLAQMLRLPKDANASLSASMGEAPANFKVYANGELIPLEDLPMQLAARTGKIVRDVEEELVFADGQRVHLLSSAAPLLDATGQVRGAVGAFMDVTVLRGSEIERRRMEARLQQSQRLESLGVLAGGIAHDFNNLLTGVLGYASLIRWELPPTSTLVPMVACIEESAQRASGLCKRMLAFAGRDQFRMMEVGFDEFLCEACRHPLIAPAPGIGIEVEAGADGALVNVDMVQLQQVVLHLLSNSAEAMRDRKGTILVKSGWANFDELDPVGMALFPETITGRYVYFEIVDQGCGMPAALTRRIFEPFFTTKFTGRGLGLAAVLGIVKSHDGGIRVTSEEGKGTTMRVYLPVVEAQKPLPSSKEEQAPQISKSSTVLVIDDDDVLLKVCRRMLERLGFHVFSAESGAKGIEVYKSKHEEIDGVLLDLTMPRMGGEETFRRLREVKAGVRVVIMTGYDETHAMTRFNAGDVVGFLSKPFTAEDLCRRVVALVRPAGEVLNPVKSS